MKRFRRAIALAVVLVLLAAGVCHAQSASIISPASSGIASADSLLVSVKVTDQRTVRVMVFQEMEQDAQGKLKAVDVSKFEASDMTKIRSA
jgi:hypothetical protein